MANEKRATQRFAIQRSVEIKLLSGTIVSGVTRDLSFAGSFIECDTSNLQECGECYLSVTLENGDKSAQIFSEIRYHNDHGVGCHFLTFDSGYYQFLTNYSLQTNGVNGDVSDA